MSIDTLGYSKHLESKDWARNDAEAEAEAINGFIVPQLATSLALENAVLRLEKSVSEAKLQIVLAVIGAGGLVVALVKLIP